MPGIPVFRHSSHHLVRGVVKCASPYVTDSESIRKRIVRVDDVGRHAGDPCGAADRRHDGAVRADRGLLEEPAREHRA